MDLIALDPGNDAGVTLFRDGVLRFTTCTSYAMRNAALVAISAGARPGATLAYERPVVYRPGDSKADPQNIVTLAITLGRWLSAIETAQLHAVKLQSFEPFTWKRNVPKEACEVRARRALSPAEIQIVEKCLEKTAPSKRHNAWDSIGLGLVALNRLRPGLV